MKRRLEGWESRLWAVIEAARKEPYVLGSHDCFRVACRDVETLTGEDRWPEFEGRYATREEALALIAEHGASFREAFSWFFGAEPVDVRFARRGDICCIELAGDKHLGVCLGRETALLGPEGLVFLETLTCLWAWRVG